MLFSGKQKYKPHLFLRSAGLMLVEKHQVLHASSNIMKTTVPITHPNLEALWKLSKCEVNYLYRTTMAEETLLTSSKYLEYYTVVQIYLRNIISRFRSREILIMDENISTVVQGIIEKFPQSKNNDMISLTVAVPETIQHENLDELNTELDTIPWAIRFHRTLLTPSCNQMEKGNRKLKYYKAFSGLLIKIERSRPINEQFPFLCNDLDALLKATALLESRSYKLLESTKILGKATTDLEKGVKNKSKEMETTVVALYHTSTYILTYD